MFIVNALASPYFLNIWNLSDATFNFTEKAIIVLPMAMLIIAREIDLSVASTLALSSTAMGLCAAAGRIPLLVCVGLGTGLLCGLLNGILVTRFNLSSIVITIGTMSLWSRYNSHSWRSGAERLPGKLCVVWPGLCLGALSFEFALFIVLAVVFTFLLHKTNFGRRTYAIGNNPVGAWYSGINVKRHNLILFALVGLMAGLAATCYSPPGLAVHVPPSRWAGVGRGNDGGVGRRQYSRRCRQYDRRHHRGVPDGAGDLGLSLLNVPGIVMSIIIGAMLIVVISLPILTRRVMRRRRI